MTRLPTEVEISIFVLKDLLYSQIQQAERELESVQNTYNEMKNTLEAWPQVETTDVYKSAEKLKRLITASEAIRDNILCNQEAITPANLEEIVDRMTEQVVNAECELKPLEAQLQQLGEFKDTQRKMLERQLGLVAGCQEKVRLAQEAVNKLKSLDASTFMQDGASLIKEVHHDHWFRAIAESFKDGTFRMETLDVQIRRAIKRGSDYSLDESAATLKGDMAKCEARFDAISQALTSMHATTTTTTTTTTTNFGPLDFNATTFSHIWVGWGGKDDTHFEKLGCLNIVVKQYPDDLVIRHCNRVMLGWHEANKRTDRSTDRFFMASYEDGRVERYVLVYQYGPKQYILTTRRSRFEEFIDKVFQRDTLIDGKDGSESVTKMLGLSVDYWDPGEEDADERESFMRAISEGAKRLRVAPEDEFAFKPS